jgi:hypothetical protein
MTTKRHRHLLAAKGNQPELGSNNKIAFSDLSPAVRRPILRTERAGKGHGRVGTHVIAVTSEAVEHPRWPGTAQIIRARRETFDQGKGKRRDC